MEAQRLLSFPRVHRDVYQLSCGVFRQLRLPFGGGTFYDKSILGVSVVMETTIFVWGGKGLKIVALRPLAWLQHWTFRRKQLIPHYPRKKEGSSVHKYKERYTAESIKRILKTYNVSIISVYNPYIPNIDPA